MNQELFERLKHSPELQPDKHDGSYELVRGIVFAYRDVDESILDYHDLNAVYLMCIGTWRHSYERLFRTHICLKRASNRWIS